MMHNLFISHKHSDTRIAKVVADFVESRTLGQVSVHMSSDPRYKGPRLGKNINQELCTALYNCDVLLLLYTSADEDWSYCMFECGVATDPQSPRTNIIVFQWAEQMSPVRSLTSCGSMCGILKISGSSPRPSSPIQDSFPRQTLRSRQIFPDDRCDEAGARVVRRTDGRRHPSRLLNSALPGCPRSAAKDRGRPE